MNKEQILEAFKSSILTIQNKGKELATNKDLYKAWKREVNTINEKIRELNSCDMLWLNDNYAKWSKENLQTDIDKFLENLKNLSPSDSNQL